MSEIGSGCKDCKHVKEHIASVLPFKVLESMSDKPLCIRGIAMCTGMSRNLKWSPFAEKAGMQKVATQQSNKSLKKLMETLLRLGFNLQLLSSQRYVKSKLDSLTEKQTTEIKTAFVASKHPRFKKEVAGNRHEPYGKTSDYVAYVEKADNLKLGKLIRILALLSQTKVYLFWSKAVVEKEKSDDSRYVGTSKSESNDVSINAKLRK